MGTQLDDRFWSKVDATGNCWLWTAGMDDAGYGWFRCGDKMRRAHRVAYEALVGPVPEGLHLDHLCRVRNCVNPDHLEPVTMGENIRRGVSGAVNGARQQAKTHCPKGHEYDEENTLHYRGGRRCRKCDRDRHRDRYQEKVSA